MTSKLTEKQERYCRHYVEYGNKSDAYRFAYDAGAMKNQTVNNNAYVLHKNNDIATRIDELREEVFEALNLSKGTVAKSFVEIRDRCMQVEPITDASGQETGEYKFDAAGAIRANIQLAKLLGLYREHNTQKVTTPMTEDEIKDELKRLKSLTQ